MKTRRWLPILLSMAGLAFFVLLLLREGPATIWASLVSVPAGYWIVLIGLRLAYWLVRTLAWRELFASLAARVSCGRLLQANLAGYAIGYVTPLSKAGGEAVRLMMVQEAGREISLAAIVAEKTIGYVAAALLISIAVGVAVTTIAMTGIARLTLAALALGCVVTLAWLVAKQHQGLLTAIWSLARRVRPNSAWLERHRTFVRDTDALILGLYRHHANVLTRVFLLNVLVNVIWVAEIHLTFRGLGAADVGLLNAFLVTVLGSLAFALPSSPGQVGVYEATYLAIFALLRIPLGPGIALILVRRALALCCCGIGLVCLAWFKQRPPSAARP